MRTAKIALTGAAGVVAVLAVAGVAVGTAGDDGPASHQYTQEQADTARRAALAATGGGTVNSVETDHENGATYEVEVTKPDGDTVDVRLDEQYRLVVIEGDAESG